MSRRLASLSCALAALRITQDEPELQLLHQLMDTRSGIGLLARGDAAAGAAAVTDPRC